MSFTYIPRSDSAWDQRAHQNFTGEKKTAPASPEFVEERREYLRCVTCGHWRLQHCTKHKLRPGQVPTDQNWKGFIGDDGQIAPCSHTLPEPKPYACDSSACAVRLGSGEDEHYCSCQKFVSPNARKRTAKTKTPKALPASAGFGTLIPKDDLIAANRRFVCEEALKLKESQLLAAATDTDLTALSAKEIAKITGMTQTQVRQTLKKIGITLPRAVREKTEFVTGVNP
jgi:hypothetical protein